MDHEVILQARISGDPQYQNNPLVTNFDVPVITEGGGLGTLAEMIFVLGPIPVYPPVNNDTIGQLH